MKLQDRNQPARTRNCGLALVLLALFAGPLAASSATFIVNSNDDAPDQTPGNGFCDTGNVIVLQVTPLILATECTLRASIEEANALAGADVVEFSSFLPTTAGFVEFFPQQDALPQISDPILIDGYSAPGYDVANPDATPVVNLGGGSVALGRGISLGEGSDGSTIRGLAIFDFSWGGMNAVSSQNPIHDLTIEGCHVGLRRGAFATGNDSLGIWIQGVVDLTLGRACSSTGCTGKGNVVAGSEASAIRMRASVRGSVAGNRIGTDPSGSTTFIPFGGSTENGYWGIWVIHGEDNLIGGVHPDAANVISGNGWGGIRVDSTGNRIYGNRIGTNRQGASALGNGGPGIQLVGGPNTVGALLPGAGNLVSGNASTGIVSEGANTIVGNTIGSTLDGASPLGNGGDGIHLGGAEANVRANAIGNNTGFGILALGARHAILDNWIGTNPLGEDLGNGFEGISVFNGDEVEIGRAGLGNTIGFNQAGIVVRESMGPNTVRGNFVGTDETGADLGNAGVGILLQDAEFTTVGERDGLTNGEGNVVGHNGGDGILLQADSASPADGHSDIVGNFIGVTPAFEPAGNDGRGVHAQSNQNRVGAPFSSPAADVASFGNRIAWNIGGAIDVTSGTQTTIRGNELFSNPTPAPIDLDDDGHTANDVGDGDAGPNRLQNKPEIDAAETGFDSLTGDLEVRYRVDTAGTEAAYPLTIDFYLSTLPGGQTDVYVGSDFYPASSATLFRSAVITQPRGAPAEGMLFATATDADGNTSELTLQSIPVPEPGFLTMTVAGCLFGASLQRGASAGARRVPGQRSRSGRRACA